MTEPLLDHGNRRILKAALGDHAEETVAPPQVGVGMPPTDGWKRKHDDSYYRAAVGKSK